MRLPIISRLLDKAWDYSFLLLFRILDEASGTRDTRDSRDTKAPVAQGTEQTVPSGQVAGSIPAEGTA